LIFIVTAISKLMLNRDSSLYSSIVSILLQNYDARNIYTNNNIQRYLY